MKHNIRFFIFTGLLLTLCLSACSPSLSTGSMPILPGMIQPVQSSNADTQAFPRQMTVSGTGKVLLVPDVAYIYIGVNTTSANVSEALAENNTLSEKVKAALVKLGIEEKDIQTSAFNIWPQQQYDQNGKVTGVNFVIDNTVFVTVRNLEKLGEILDTSVQSGANSINSIEFDVLDKDESLSKARKLAVEKANLQAQELAKASGVQLGQLINVSEYTGNSEQPMNYSAYGMSRDAKMESASVPISAGQLMLSTTVNLTYEIK